MVLTSITQAESPRHDGIALTPVYAHQKRSDNIVTRTALHVLTNMYTSLETQLVPEPCTYRAGTPGKTASWLGPPRLLLTAP